MARKSNDIRPGKDMSKAGKAADRSLAVAMIKVIAVGFAGGLAMIAGAKKLGDKFLDLDSNDIPEIPDIEDIEGSGEDEEEEADSKPEDDYIEDIEAVYEDEASDETAEDEAEAADEQDTTGDATDEAAEK